jgi:DNA-binding NtrC family response regulator
MLEITLKRSGKSLLKEPIGSNPITIGRSADNTLRLLDPDISRTHCRIEWVEGALRATDLSSNGMLLNGQVVREAEVNAGDSISIGPWTLRIDSRIDAVPVKTLVSSPYTTRVISYDPVKKKLATERMEILVNSPEQAQLRRRLSRASITIGHHASCDVAVADPYVSRRHCRLLVRDGQVQLIDLASTNGVFVGDTRVTQVAMPPHGAFRVGQSVVHYRLVTETSEVTSSSSNRLGNMIGVSKHMRDVFGLIERVAPTEATILITGESGTGKEVVAREIHERSGAGERPFVAINCGALPSGIIESQLFGHERGAFTGALERSPGLFEQAHGGTLFLDEIGEMPLELQTRLLRVLETKTVRRIGGREELAVDFRLVCATNRNLSRMVCERRFREDLLFRIFVVPIELAPLRERCEDILALAKHFLSELAPAGRSPSFTDAAFDALLTYSWPGNVRELRNAIERTLVLAGHDIIEAGDINIGTFAMREPGPISFRVKEKDHIENVLRQNEGNIAHTAKKLGIARTTLQKKIRKYGIEVRKGS